MAIKHKKDFKKFGLWLTNAKHKCTHRQHNLLHHLGESSGKNYRITGVWKYIGLNRHIDTVFLHNFLQCTNRGDYVLESKSALSSGGCDVLNP